MAVLDGVPGLTVRIVVNGEGLREYEDRHAEVAEKTVERYVEPQTGKSFEIHYTFDESFPRGRAVCLSIMIDGRIVDLPIVRRHELRDPAGHLSRGPIYKGGSGWKVRKYEFAAMTIGEYLDATRTCGVLMK